MVKSKLIVIEGPDGTGKSTQCATLSGFLPAKLISQPSPDNIVGNIRQLAKTDKSYTPFERQLLIAISHTVDAYSKFDGTENIVMDRSYLSGLVYGQLTMSPSDTNKFMLLVEILQKVYRTNIGNKYDVRVIFMTGSKRLDQADKDIFESTIHWQDINFAYDKLYRHPNPHFFSPNEKVCQLNVDGKSIEQINREIMISISGHELKPAE